MVNSENKLVDILVVEDNPGDALLIQEGFKMNVECNSLSIATDGAMAMDFLYKKGKYKNVSKPDLVILDLNLPKKSGMEVLAEIKANEDLKSIPVVILTSSIAEQDIMGTYLLHANSYVRKPFVFEQFVSIIKSLEEYWMNIVKLPLKE
jgi:two-component system, chemotaxis family, response regulator Rcp1